MITASTRKTPPRASTSGAKNTLGIWSGTIEKRGRARGKPGSSPPFETVLIDISTRFIGLQADRMDKEIVLSLQRVCESLGLDVCALWQFSPDQPENWSMTHVFIPPDFPPVSAETTDAQKSFPWCLRTLLKKKTIALSRISDAPAVASRDRASWAHYGLISVLTLPLFVGDGPAFGALSFNTVKEERVWSPDLVEKLRTVARIFASALSRKQIETALRESETRLSLTTEAVGAGLWIMNVDTGSVWASPQSRDLFHFAPDEKVSYESYFRVIHPADRDLVHRAVQKTLETGEVLNVDYRISLPDGRVRWIAARGRLHPRSADGPERLMGLSLDITDRKEAELALAESEERYRMLFESAPAGMLVIGEGGTVRAANSLQARLYGYEAPEQLIGLYAPTFVAERDRERSAQNMRSLLEGGEIPERTYTAVRRDGSEFTVEVTSIPLRGPAQDLQGYLCITRDITKDKQGENELVELRHELAHLARVMAMNELSTSLAHEINQPLGAILNNAQAARTLLALVEGQGGEFREIVEDIIQDALRAGDVIRKIRGLVKKSEVRFEPLSLNVLINDVVKLVRNSLALNGVTLRLDLTPDLASVRGDRVRLQQILMNLMTNAIDAVKNAPSRVLAVRSAMPAADTVVVSVRDSGKGLSQTELDHAFKPFFTTKMEGLGIGLTICRAIIEEHGGRIWAENNPAGGATFSFSLNAWPGGPAPEPGT